MFHGLYPALITASSHNKQAGKKVARVRILKGHFMLVNQEEERR